MSVNPHFSGPRTLERDFTTVRGHLRSHFVLIEEEATLVLETEQEQFFGVTANPHPRLPTDAFTHGISQLGGEPSLVRPAYRIPGTSAHQYAPGYALVGGGDP